MTAIFITATGTDVGKTFVAASLIGHFRQMGRVVEVIKPVVSGFDPTQAATSDPAVLIKALGVPVTPAGDRADLAVAISRSPCRPISRRGARGETIDVDEVIAFCQSAIEQRQDMLLIEGVGGVMVPLDDQRTILDVMMALRLPLILVAGSYLGTISHTLTALNSLYRRDMNVMAIVVSETPGSTMPLDETVAAISRFADPVIGLPRRRSQDREPGGAAPFGRLLDPQGHRAR